MDQQLRAILDEVAGLSRPAADIALKDDLFAAGLTSFATVGVMLAIEDEFDVAFPDALLVRSTFASIAALRAAVAELTGQVDAA